MIDQIEDKEIKSKYIKKIIEQQSTKPKSYLPVANINRIKDVIEYFKDQEPATVQDLQIELKQIKTQIEELKRFNQTMDYRISNLENKKEILTPQNLWCNNAAVPK